MIRLQRKLQPDLCLARSCNKIEDRSLREGASGAQLTSNFLLATWSTAFVQAHDVYRKDGDVNAAKARFLKVVERGKAGIATAMAGTAYAAS